MGEIMQKKINLKNNIKPKGEQQKRNDNNYKKRKETNLLNDEVANERIA
jgi:hypothetical protein